jgi:Mg-chelatase subunit ChlD
MNHSLKTLFSIGTSVVALALVATGCSSSTTSSYESGGTSSYAPAPGTGGSSGSSAPGSSGGGSAATGNGSGQVEASVLTVGLWDDNKNFPHFEHFLGKNQDSKSYFTLAEQQAARDEFATRSAHSALDVGILLDTTGSMGDELDYLKRELSSIQQAIGTRTQDVRYGVVTYRDKGDDYLTHSTPFTADLAVSQNAIKKEQAGGGGDIPEAVEEGLAAANQLAWRQDPNVAKVLFWVADAPEHEQDRPKVVAALKAARAAGVHIYPIAASGVSGEAELTMRISAQYTGGRYLFLTDDSGVGNSHAEPSIPCYVVQKMSAAMQRVVRVELSGTYEAATPTDIVRSAGTIDQAGKCTVPFSAAAPAPADPTDNPLTEAWVF